MGKDLIILIASWIFVLYFWLEGYRSKLFTFLFIIGVMILILVFAPHLLDTIAKLAIIFE